MRRNRKPSLKAGATHVISGAPVAKMLLATAEDGKYLQRAFGGLACGLVVREIHDDLELDVYQEFKQKVMRAGKEKRAA